MTGDLSRRHLIAGGAAALGVTALPRTAGGQPASAAAPEDLTTVSCFGPTQAGLTPPLPPHTSFVAFDLRPAGTRRELAQMLALWADDIARLTAAQPALTDASVELATLPTGLTIAVGFGPGVFQLDGLARQRPDWLRELPAFDGDDLRPQWSGGDVVLQVRGLDPLAIAAATRVLQATADFAARPRWVQRGFQRAAAVRPAGTDRNLMGFLDGTVNPQPGTPDWDDVVTVSTGPDWLRGGTGLVLRRIRMNLATWSTVDRRTRELIMGRRLDSGAPLTGAVESDVPDLTAVDDAGLAVIPEFAHIRLARHQQPHERISRQAYNYDDTTGSAADAGLLFAAYAADPQRQFVPLQRRLAAGDALNRWITHVGSAVFAIPPGFTPGGFPGDRLLA